MKKIYCGLILLLAIFSCSPKLSPDHSWRNKRWVLREMNGNPVQLSGTDKDAHLIFNASEKRFSGTGGCNRITGPYTMTNNGELSFGQSASTKMACPDLAFEDRFMSLLSSVNGFEIKGEDFFMKKGKQIVLKFK